MRISQTARCTAVLAVTALAGLGAATTLYTTSFEGYDAADPWLYDYGDWWAESSIWTLTGTFGGTDGAGAASCQIYTGSRNEDHNAAITPTGYTFGDENPGVKVSADVLLTDQPRLYSIYNGKGTGWAGILLGSNSDPLAKLIMRYSDEDGGSSAFELYVRTASGMSQVAQVSGVTLGSWTRLAIDANYDTGLLKFSMGSYTTGSYAFVGDPTATLGFYSNRDYSDRFHPNPIWSAFDSVRIETTSAVPEPATWFLAFGILPFLRRRRR